MEINLVLKIDDAGHCAAHWSIYSERGGFLATGQTCAGTLEQCLKAVRESVTEQLDIDKMFEGAQ